MRVCVFCGSSPAQNTAFAQAARTVGHLLAERHIELVYGGATVGLMGEVAEATLDAGGDVIGVIPQNLVDHEVAHTQLSELMVVDTMHERKARMAELADAFIALPGGLGTLEELFEIWTWAHLGLHNKPIGALDIDGFFGPLRVMVDRMVDEGFVRSTSRDFLLVDADPARLLDRFTTYTPPPDRWSPTSPAAR